MLWLTRSSYVCGWERGCKGVILKCSLAAAGRFQWKSFKVYGGEASLTALELIGNKWVHMVSFKVRKGSRRFLRRGPYTCAWTTCCVKYVWGGVFRSQGHIYSSRIKQRSKEDEFTFGFPGFAAYCMLEWFAMDNFGLVGPKTFSINFVAVSGVKVLQTNKKYRAELYVFIS